ncbi:hypothetical protein N7448_000597 [Penicillium atrosanguineum]|nr:hypothetical protein N7526_005746 [Penicillium atrosanguineum]KAJ5149019.1 hypothetical protein N7448_000597 [Penicillium atrosanguineum]
MSECHNGPDTGTDDVFVGKLFRWNPKTEERIEPLVIDSCDEVFIGRDTSTCQYSSNHMFVSSKHVRIYTVIYDEYSSDTVPPLVYAQDISTNGTRWNGYAMQGKSFLLSDGDILTIVPEFQLLFESAANPQKNFSEWQKAEMKVFKSSYCVTRRELGSGAYGRVQMAYQIATGQQIACKIVDIKSSKAKCELELQQELKHTKLGPSAQRAALYRLKSIDEKLERYYREAQLLETLSHPNIISFETAIHSPNTIYIFSELVTAGDLVSFLRYRGGTLKEREAAFITRQVLLAIEYLHDRDIVHRDIKPDNILITSLGQCGRIVLTDFGCARRVPQPVERMQTVTGTYEYCAPEVNSANNAGYSKSIDLYSLGCVTVTLLMGFLPTREPHRRFDRNGDEQKGLTKELNQNRITGFPQQFIKELLILDEKLRLNVKQALRHNWFEFLPERDELECRYQVAVDQWIPRPRSDPSIVTLADLEAFQNSAGQAYTLYTRPGERLQNYRLFEINTHIPDLSFTRTPIQAIITMPTNAENCAPPSRQQEDVPSVQGGHHACLRVWSPPSASSSLFSSRHEEDDHAELIHRTKKVPGYLNVDENQPMERSVSHPRRIAEVTKEKFVSQIGHMGPVQLAFEPAPPPDSHRRDEDLLGLSERLTQKPRFPSNDSLFYMEMEGEPVRRSAPPESTTSMRYPGSIAPTEKLRFPQGNDYSFTMGADFSSSPAPPGITEIPRYPSGVTSFFGMAADKSHNSAPAVTSAMNNASLFHRGVKLAYRPTPTNANTCSNLRPNRPYTRQRAAEDRNVDNRAAEDGAADNRGSHGCSKRKRHFYSVQENYFCR